MLLSEIDFGYEGIVADVVDGRHAPFPLLIGVFLLICRRLRARGDAKKKRTAVILSGIAICDNDTA